MSKVTIIDYDIGNLFNIERAFDFLNIQIEVTNETKKIESADRLLLPGVGAFAPAIEKLKEKNLDQAILKFLQSNRPLLGICLGMQLLFSESFEHGKWLGLDIIKGKVMRFKESENNEFKVPQIGWNTIRNIKPAQNASILSGLENDDSFYFVHSYCCYPTESQDSHALTDYGLDTFTSVVQKDNICGCQFHPERSASAGLKILKNFLLI